MKDAQRPRSPGAGNGNGKIMRTALPALRCNALLGGHRILLNIILILEASLISSFELREIVDLPVPGLPSVQSVLDM